MPHPRGGRGHESGPAANGQTGERAPKVTRTKAVGLLVRPEGLEPPAYWFEASRSIQLSYGRMASSYHPNER